MMRGEIMLAAGIALPLHLLLLFGVRPSTENVSNGRLSPPHTRYMAQLSEEALQKGETVRSVNSPVVFSLPSVMGFNRELRSHDVRTRLSFSQQVEAEKFLQVKPSAKTDVERLEPQELMISAYHLDPGLPKDPYTGERLRPSPRRIIFPLELQNRLMSDIVLPPELSKTDERPWEVRASISVSEQGAVEHVFLDRPLESASLNQQILRMVHGLRFKPGKAVESSIEIYSNETESEGRQDK